MNTSLFRQVSLDRMSSPEQLDQLLRITSTRAWAILAAILALLITGVIWGFTGSIVTTATGTGVIVRQGGVLNIVSNGAGIVSSIRVEPGAEVRANEVVAQIAQPALLQQLQSLENARTEASLARQESLRREDNAAQLKLDANDRQHAGIETQVIELQEKAKLLDQQIAIEQQLFHKGLVTNQQVLDIQQKRAGVGDDIAAAKVQLKQLEADRFTIAAQPRQQDVERQMRVADLDRQISAAKESLKLAEDVVSPYDGQVLEVKASLGGTVSGSQPIVSIQPRRENLELLAYMPSLLAKDVRPGMDAEVSPSNIKREEYGFIRGHVDFVADYPATRAALMRNFENDALVNSLSAGGAVTELRATLQGDPASASGFAWSTSRGPAAVITSGTICQVNIVTKREKPIFMIFPHLQAMLEF